MKRLLAGGLAVLAVAVTVALTVSSDRFDAETWRAQKGVERNNARNGMLSALERKHLKPGMGREEVHRLLGPPDRRDAARDVYELGQSPVGPSYESYVIEYDAADKVVAFRLSRS